MDNGESAFIEPISRFMHGLEDPPSRALADLEAIKTRSSAIAGRPCDQGRGKAGSGGSADPPKNLELRSEIALSFTSDRCQINGNGHLYNFNTLETTCLH